MNQFSGQIDVAALALRMRERLAPGHGGKARVVWERGGSRLLLHHGSLKVRAVGGWLVCQLILETAEAGAQELEFVFFLGKPGEGDGAQAGATINATRREGAQLAEQWGAEVQRVLWDALLDAFEAVVAQVRTRTADALRVRGFYGSDDALQVQVLTGEL